MITAVREHFTSSFSIATKSLIFVRRMIVLMSLANTSESRKNNITMISTDYRDQRVYNKNIDSCSKMRNVKKITLNLSSKTNIYTS